MSYFFKYKSDFLINGGEKRVKETKVPLFNPLSMINVMTLSWSYLDK